MPITQGGTWSPDRRIVSPGVFTRENDLSGLAQGVADIGAAVVAPFPKGPGFSPILITDTVTLENVFGVADGVFYGPYTAKEYLIEKGFVTVCRVGALTGYHQKYPFVIYAINGNWVRAVDSGWTAPSSSQALITPTILSGSVWTSSATDNTSSVQGTLTIKNVPVVVTFAAVPASGILGGSHSSGSQFYAGLQESLGVFTVILDFSGSVGFSVTGSATARDAAVAAFFTSSQLYNVFPTNNAFSIEGWSGIGTAPFTSSTVTGVTMSISPLTCGAGYGYFVEGLVTSELGAYTGFSTAGTPTYNPCSQSWTTGSANLKILTVLADTQNNPVNTSLIATGFSGSFMITASNPVNSIPVEFNLTLQNSLSTNPYGVYNFSLNEASPKYITSVFGNNPQAGALATQVQGAKIEAAYIYKIFENEIARVVADSTHWFISGTILPNAIFDGSGNLISGFPGEPMNFTDNFSLQPVNGDSQFGLSNAFTPWVVSQQIAPFNGGSPIRYNLFRFATLGDGTYTNTAFKIEISNVKLAGTVSGTDWGTFTVTVRNFSDTDRKPVIVEQYNNVTLDPTSADFIGRRIGDAYNFINANGKILQFGTYANQSPNIRVETTDIPYPVNAVPYGFVAYALPIDSAAGFWLPPVKYTQASVYGPNPGKYPSGVNFDDAPTGADSQLFGLYPTASLGVGTADDNLQYFAPLPAFDGAGGTYSSIGRNVTFALDLTFTNGGIGTGSFITGSNAIPSVLDESRETTYVKMRKFVFGFQGGFDGQSPAIPINVGDDILPGNTQGLDCTNISSAGSVAYTQAVGALGNADEFDINMIVTPGILHDAHPYVTQLVVDMCEARGDCFYILDLYTDAGNPTTSQVEDVVLLAQDFDTNYAGSYYPWVKIKDENTNDIITVPPSVVLPAVFASNDKVAGEWFAVAGLNRGGITAAVQVTDRTTHEERDTLYEGKVNPIAAFPGQGITVWGQKTLQNKNSALNRINVRRLLIAIKKFFASTGRFLVFEQNTAATRNRFLAIANPFLQSIQQRSGLFAFNIIMDDTNNTPDIIDQNILYGQIFLQPTKTAEFILFDFNILPTGGATFGQGA